MNWGVLSASAALLLAAAVNAQQQPAESTTAPPVQADLRQEKPVIDWDDPEWWDYFAAKEQPDLRVPLGSRGRQLTISGPLARTFRPLGWKDLTPLEKITSLPILSLFVPQPMPTTPVERGPYFAWGEREESWTHLSDRPIPGPGAWLKVGK